MKLVVIADRWDAADDSGHRWAVETVRHLAARGHLVHVLAGWMDVLAAAEPGIDLTAWPGMEDGGDATQSPAAFARWADAAAGQTGADLTLALTSVVPAEVVHAWSAPLSVVLRRSPRPSIGDVRLRLREWLVGGRNRRRRIAAEAAALVHPRLRAVVALTQTIAGQFAALRGPDRRNIVVIPPGVDRPPLDTAAAGALRARLRGAMGLHQQHVAVLAPVHWTRMDRLPPLLAALRHALPTVPNLVMLLAGQLSFGVHHQAAQQGLREHIRLVPVAGRLGDLYYAADLAIGPQHYHPCSREVIEALARGVPVVAHADDGASLFIATADGRQRGRVVPDTPDAGAMGTVLAELAQARQLAAARTAAQQTVDDWAMVSHAARLESLLEQARRQVAGPDYTDRPSVATQ